MLTLVVDTGLGNLYSVEKAVETAARMTGQPHHRIERSSDLDRISRADRLIVPGQGGFRDLSLRLASGLGEVLLDQLKRGTPYFGICLGLQILFESSQEAPGHAGLGWFRGEVRELEGGPEVKIPHMGWNSLDFHGEPHPVLQAAGGPGTWFYFVHSFHAVPTEPGVCIATVGHGSNQVTAAVARDHVLATQFHPEKSQRGGLALLTEFLKR